MQGKKQKRIKYTAEEVTLCTYAAMYNSADFGGNAAIRNLQHTPAEKHSMKSIIMKIENIASMLDERKILRYNNITPLSGKTTGEKGRKTHWNVVEPLYPLKQEDFLEKCKAIIKKAKALAAKNQ